MKSIRIIGAGRAGLSFEAAFSACGYDLAGVWHHTDDLSAAASGVDVLLLAVPDRAIVATAAAVDPVPGTVVLHCSGASTLEVLAPHARRGPSTPSSPFPSLSSERCGCGEDCSSPWRAIPWRGSWPSRLSGHPVVVTDSRRAGYHAAASIAANHLVALLGQVERVAATVGLPLEAFLPLAQGALDDVGFLGPAAALTGPCLAGRRGDPRSAPGRARRVGALRLRGRCVAGRAARR